nr:protein NYNRIN-like [Syngnathus scovelli]
MVKQVEAIYTTYGFAAFSKQFCRACLICAKHNPQGNLRPQRGKFPTPLYPFQTIHMDYIQLHKCEGKEYCLVIIDAFTKWVETFPTKHADVLAVAKALCKDIIPRYGIPEKIYSDNGPHFVNQIVHNIGRMFHINLKNHCSYRSQSVVERSNATIKNRLKKCMEETKRPWTQCLDLVKMYIDITSTTGLTPYETMFGRPYRLPQFKNTWEIPEEATLADYMRKMLERQKNLTNNTDDEPISPQEDPKVVPGDWVLIKSIKRKNWHSPKWEGPFLTSPSPQQVKRCCLELPDLLQSKKVVDVCTCHFVYALFSHDYFVSHNILSLHTFRFSWDPVCDF